MRADSLREAINFYRSVQQASWRAEARLTRMLVEHESQGKPIDQLQINEIVGEALKTLRQWKFEGEGNGSQQS